MLYMVKVSTYHSLIKVVNFILDLSTEHLQ